MEFLVFPQRSFDPDMKQNYPAYTDNDRLVWSTLYKRQRENLEGKAHALYLECLDELRPVMNEDRIPNFDDLNAALDKATGWSIHVVKGLIPVEAFFELLAQRKFPASTWLRTMEQLDYLEEPDMFHDIFGHIPMLLDPQYAAFMHEFGSFGAKNLKKAHVVRALQNLYWFTIEFGVVSSPTQVYGAGIISSFGETNHIYHPTTTVNPFVYKQVAEHSFINSEIQQEYYRIEALDELFALRDKFE